jgi:nucleoside-diphosphate-sugar epimerase
MSMASYSKHPQKRALITGIAGFTGRYLADELRRSGYRVFGLVHHGVDISEDCFSADLCDLEAVREVVAKTQPDVVAHLAAISFVAHGSAEAIYRVNVIGARNLLEALAETDQTPSAVLLASSANVYGNANVEIIDETTPLAPANDYAVSKLSMEYMARLWNDQLPIVTVRPFNYTGVHQAEHFLAPKIVSHFVQGKRHIELGNLDVARDFSDVRSVVTAYRRLLEAAPAGEVFNVCSGMSYSLQDILHLMARIAGYEISVQVNPAFVRRNEVKRLVGSRVKLEKATGELPAISFEQTLRWMYRSAAQ